MIFDVYFPFLNKEGKWCPGTKSKPMEFSAIMESLMRNENYQKTIAKIRETGDKELKKHLPAICFTGKSKTGKRMANDMEPTQFVMCDLDHCENPQEAYAKINEINGEGNKFGLMLAHVTPSGKGLRLVFRADWRHGLDTLPSYLKFLGASFDVTKYGDWDTAVKDLSRLSFIVGEKDVLYCNPLMYQSETDDVWKNFGSPIKAVPSTQDDPRPSAAEKPKQGEVFDGVAGAFTTEELENFESFTYRGTPIKAIVQKYVEVNGVPGPGERHNYYNNMVKNFRCICDNNKRLLLYVLPEFGHTLDERWSQIKSICRVNTLSRIPSEFYFFLKDNGYLVGREHVDKNLKEFMLSEDSDSVVMPPYLPPVFRELVGNAPKDFVVPAMNALLPILGTLTSYVRAIYPYDGRMHSTSFFSVIYAPPGTGKGFVERFLDLLFEDLKLRDFVQSQRENIYLRVLTRRGANDKAPEQPHTSLRIIPAKNSEAEFLQKQFDNHGYHMFTYAAEMDSWAKGVRAAGGNKDDMVRVAWDNGEYGQQFKSPNTFKGTVKLYWNVLITGTILQVENYFKNVENGLVTRCSFCSIDNQEFSLPAKWKDLNKRELAVIRKFMNRCDENTYETPCTINPIDLTTVSDDDFDKEIDWRFQFKPFKEVDMSWIMPTIDAFHKEQMELALLDIDHARDVFRRRVGVRGFRLAMVCVCLWDRPRESDLKRCAEFVNWWMHIDLDNMLKLWGVKYNSLSDVVPNIVQRSVFDMLGNTFQRNDVYTVCLKQGIKTPVRRIIFDWKKLGCIVQEDKETFKKVEKFIKKSK